MKCPCNTECTDCVAGFQKIIDLKNAGLVIYRRTTETKDVNKITGNIDYVDKTIEDIYIIHNTKDTDISSADYWPEIEHNTITCPRCKIMIEHAQNLLKKGPTICGNDVTGICAHCKMKGKPCYKCRQVVKRFVPSKPDRTDIKKGRLKYWLTKIGCLLQDINNITDEKKRSHSDTHIDQICNDRQMSKRKPDVEQLLKPLELDLAGISQPYINSRINGQNKEKRPVAHFPQLEKLETPIVFIDPITKVVPSTYALFKDDETLGEKSNFNVRRILKPDNASPVRINISQTVSNEESVVSFEQIFKDTISGTSTQQEAKTRRKIPESDELFGVKPNETKHSPNIIISENIKEKSTRRKRSTSVHSFEIKQEKVLHTKTKESNLTELLTKYHSAETLKIHDITELNFKKANRIIFPRQQSNKPTKQKSSSELIKDTKNKLTISKEEKKLKQISYERTGHQSDGKDIARKKSENAIDYQEFVVYDKENARQEAKQSDKSDEKDKFRAKEEIHKTRKGSQKSPNDTDVIEEKSRKFEKETQTAFEKFGNKSEKYTQKAPIDTQKYGYKSEKGAKKFTEDVQKVEEDGYKPKKETQKAPKQDRKAVKADAHGNEKGAQKTPREAQKAERGGYTPDKSVKEPTKDTQIVLKKTHKFEKGAQKTLTDAQKAKNYSGISSQTEQKRDQKAGLRGQKTTKDILKPLRDAEKEEKDGYKSEKVTEKTQTDAQKAKKDGHETEKGAQKTPRDAHKAERGGYTQEKSSKEPTKDTQIAVKKTHKLEKGAQEAPTDAPKAKNDAEISYQKEQKHDQKADLGGRKTTKDLLKSLRDAEKEEKDGYKSEKVPEKTPKDAQKAKKDAYETEKGDQKTPRDAHKAERGGYTQEKSSKEPTKDTQIAVKKTHKLEKGAQEAPTDAPKAKNDAEISSQKEQKHGLKAELGGKKTTKDFLKSLRDTEKDMTPKSPKIGQELQKELQNTDINTKKNAKEATDFEIEKQVGSKFKQKTQALEKKTKNELPTSEIKIKNDQELKLKAEKENAIKKGLENYHSTEINTKKISMEATELEFKKPVGLILNKKPQELEKKTQLQAEKEKADAFKKKLDDEAKLDTRLGAKSISPDMFEMKSIKIKQSNTDDLILKLVQIKRSTLDGDRVRKIPKEPIKDMRLPDKRVPQGHILVYTPQSETWSNDSEIDELIKEPQVTDVIIGPQICTIRPLILHDDLEVMPPLLKSGYDSSQKDKKQENAQTPEKLKAKESIKPPENEKQEAIVSTETQRTKEAIKPTPQSLSPGSVATGSTNKGFVRYTLSDRKFIDNGWTLLPTEKVVRKMNVYRMRPAHPEFDWFEHNKNKRLMQYDTGEKLAEFDDNGRGRWYYRNGRMALDYYNAEELNAGQRFVIYSNGEPDERGRSRPYTLLATFDFSGNGIVFDHRGKIRLKYNQTEGVVLDRSIGPVSHWKWHTLNDPPVLQQVMLDTQIAHKDPKIMKMGGPNENKPRKDNEEMLAIEFDNFIKEKSKKLSQTFKPFQIKMKALKINEHFSLRVLDQATVYLLYRDGTTNLKLNIGMVLNQKEIVDTDTAEVGEVSSSMEKLPARTESLAGLQRSVAHAQHYDWKRTERERKMHPAEPNASVDKLVAGISRPLRPPTRPVLSPSTSVATTEHCKCSRKPTSTSVYYDTRFF